MGKAGFSIVHRSPHADREFVTQLIETRWTRYGKDRVYEVVPVVVEVEVAVPRSMPAGW